HDARAMMLAEGGAEPEALAGVDAAGDARLGILRCDVLVAEGAVGSRHGGGRGRRTEAAGRAELVRGSGPRRGRRRSSSAGDGSEGGGEDERERGEAREETKRH